MHYVIYMIKSIISIGKDLDILDILKEKNMRFLGCITKVKEDTEDNVPVLGTDKDWKTIREQHQDFNVILAVDSGRIRHFLLNRYKAFLTNLVAKGAIVSEYAKINSTGVLIQSGVRICPFVKVGLCVKINLNAIIHHGSQVSDFVTIGPSAVILGNVKIGDFSYIGANATIRQNISIGKNCIVGAGAVVVKDTPDNTIIAGVPARKLRDNKSDI